VRGLAQLLQFAVDLEFVWFHNLQVGWIPAGQAKCHGQAAEPCSCCLSFISRILFVLWLRWLYSGYPASTMTLRATASTSHARPTPRCSAAFWQHPCPIVNSGPHWFAPGLRSWRWFRRVWGWGSRKSRKTRWFHGGGQTRLLRLLRTARRRQPTSPIRIPTSRSVKTIANTVSWSPANCRAVSRSA